MKKMVSGLLAVLLLFVSGRYVLLEAVKSFFQSSEETGLKSEEYGDRQEEGDTETELDEDNYDDTENEFDEDMQQYDGQETNEENMSTPWEAITSYGSVTYELGDVHKATEVIADAGLQLPDVNVQTKLDISPINYQVPGTYQVETYGINEAERLRVEIIIDVTIVDNIAPVITGDKYRSYYVNVPLTQKQFLADLLISVEDNSAERIEPFVDFNAVDFTTTGMYTATVYASDSSGNEAEPFDVQVGILPAPILRIDIGKHLLRYELGTEITELMIKQDSGLHIEYVRPFTMTAHINMSRMNMNEVGTYTVPIDARDSYGNYERADLTVEIVDTSPPVIEGSAYLGYRLNEPISPTQFILDANILVSDNSTETITPDVDLTAVDFNKAGTYDAIITATDSNGNKAKPFIVHVVVGDTTPPTIDLAAEVTYNNESARPSDRQFMLDANILITDNSKETLTPIFDLNTVDFAKPGIYSVEVTATDRAGNTSTAVVRVVIADTMPPTITVTTDVLIYEGGTIVGEAQVIKDAEITVTDNTSEHITPSIDLTLVDIDKAGTYEAGVIAKDSAGNIATTKVMITITADRVEISPFAVNIQTNYQNMVRGSTQPVPSQAEFLRILGFRATDENGNNLNATVNTANVRWNQEGRYTAYVFVTDPATNQVIRRDIPVQIWGGTAVIDVKPGAREVTYEVGEDVPFARLWSGIRPHFGTDVRLTTRHGFVVAEEAINRDGGRVDTSKPGDYPGFFWADANSGQSGRFDFVVHVVDTRPPVMGIGSAELEYPVGTPKTPEEVLADANITITDNSGEEITPEVDLSPVDWDTPGDYEVDVTAKDSSGNTVTNKIKITVYDREPPVIQGPDTHEMPIGQQITEDDIRKIIEVTDNSKADIDPEIDMSKVDTSKPGKYPVEIKAKDPSGNESTKIIEVEVQDKEPPVIDGADKRQYPRGKPLNPDDIIRDMGIKVTDNSGEDITPEVDMSQVDTSKPGTYPVDITAEDSSGNKTTKRVEITIPDDGTGGGNNGGGNGNNGGGNGNNGGGNGNNGGGNNGSGNGGGNGGAGNNNGGLGGGGGSGGNGGLGGGPLARTGGETNVYQYLIGSVLAGSSLIIFIRKRRRKDEA